MRDINRSVPDYAEASFARLAQVEQQYPLVGGDDLYYGGTSYFNLHGWAFASALGTAEGAALPVRPARAEAPVSGDELTLIPVRLLYDRGPLFEPAS
jgi:NADH-quinone oxidoreductase subunit G